MVTVAVDKCVEEEFPGRVLLSEAVSPHHELEE